MQAGANHLIHEIRLWTEGIHDLVRPRLRLRVQARAGELAQGLRTGIDQTDRAALVAALLNGDAAHFVEQFGAILQAQDGRTGAAQHAVGASKAA